MFDHCKNCNRDSDYQFVICDHCNNQICILCYIKHNKKDDDDDNDSIDSWWSVNNPIQAQEMYHSAKLMLDDIEYEELFIESMSYFKTLLNI